ncbi:MAG: hypothetical protein IPG81_28030 [Sandaracinaceae bacterium]|nr:hypothetical protein [Sandaracinaceae bacterium]
MGRVSLVGGSAEMQRAALRATLADAGIEALDVAVDTRAERVSALVAAAVLDDAVRALHAGVVLASEHDD